MRLEPEAFGLLGEVPEDERSISAAGRGQSAGGIDRDGGDNAEVRGEFAQELPIGQREKLGPVESAAKEDMRLIG